MRGGRGGLRRVRGGAAGNRPVRFGRGRFGRGRLGRGRLGRGGHPGPPFIAPAAAPGRRPRPGGVPARRGRRGRHRGAGRIARRPGVRHPHAAAPGASARRNGRVAVLRDRGLARLPPARPAGRPGARAGRNGRRLRAPDPRALPPEVQRAHLPHRRPVRLRALPDPGPRARGHGRPAVAAPGRVRPALRRRAVPDLPDVRPRRPGDRHAGVQPPLRPGRRRQPLLAGGPGGVRLHRRPLRGTGGGVRRRHRACRLRRGGPERPRVALQRHGARARRRGGVRRPRAGGRAPGAPALAAGAVLRGVRGQPLPAARAGGGRRHPCVARRGAVVRELELLRPHAGGVFPVPAPAAAPRRRPGDLAGRVDVAAALSELRADAGDAAGVHAARVRRGDHRQHHLRLERHARLLPRAALAERRLRRRAPVERRPAGRVRRAVHRTLGTAVLRRARECDRACPRVAGQPQRQGVRRRPPRPPLPARLQLAADDRARRVLERAGPRRRQRRGREGFRAAGRGGAGAPGRGDRRRAVAAAQPGGRRPAGLRVAPRRLAVRQRALRRGPGHRRRRPARGGAAADRP